MSRIGEAAVKIKKKDIGDLCMNRNFLKAESDDEKD